jgi:DNA-binding HxlR family transcriptional regulator
MKNEVKTDSTSLAKLNVSRKPCAIENGTIMVRAKWSVTIIYHLGEQSLGFNDLCRLIGGATRKIIDQRLKELEVYGIVKRKVISERPFVVRYHLTDFGRTALNILKNVTAWSDKN